MNLLLGWTGRDNLPEKVHELLAGVPRSRLALDLAGAHIERGIQRQRSVAIVLESVAFDPPWFPVTVVLLRSAPGTALTLLTEPDVDAEPAEMLAAQQTETRPTATVAAARR